VLAAPERASDACGDIRLDLLIPISTIDHPKASMPRVPTTENSGANRVPTGLLRYGRFTAKNLSLTARGYLAFAGCSSLVLARRSRARARVRPFLPKGQASWQPSSNASAHFCAAHKDNGSPAKPATSYASPTISGGYVSSRNVCASVDNAGHPSVTASRGDRRTGVSPSHEQPRIQTVATETPHAGMRRNAELRAVFRSKTTK
jgi:hypothetical protein